MDSVAVNLTWSLCCLFSSLGMSLLPLGTAGWLGCLWGRLTTSEQVSKPQPGPSPEWVRGKELLAAGQSAWLPFGKRTTYPQERRSHHSVPLPFHQHIQEGHSINPTSLPSQGAKFPAICQPRKKKKSSNLGGGMEGNNKVIQNPSVRS